MSSVCLEPLWTHKGCGLSQHASTLLEYLNGTPKGRKGAKNLDGVNKYSEIMAKLKVIFAECPGYRLYVTGHSLGASLSQLFAMEAAASNEEFIPTPVTTINFASPKVGDIYFRNCFEVCCQLDDR